jgi:hypothetical protein
MALYSDDDRKAALDAMLEKFDPAVIPRMTNWWRNMRSGTQEDERRPQYDPTVTVEGLNAG